MPFDYNANLTAVLNALKDYNTTTASPDLSSGLNTRVNNDNILGIDPELTSPRADRMPAIYVTISNKEEDAAAIGATGIGKTKKEATVIFDVWGVVGKYGGWEGQSVTLSDVYELAENIEGVFQAEYKLSGTAMFINPVTTEFSPVIELGESFAKIVQVRLEAHYLFN